MNVSNKIVEATILKTVLVRTGYDAMTDSRWFEFSQTDVTNTTPVVVSISSELAQNIGLLAPLAQNAAQLVKSNLEVPASLEFTSEIILAWFLKGFAFNLEGAGWKVATKATQNMSRPPESFFETFPCLKVKAADLTKEHGPTWLAPEMITWYSNKKKSTKVYTAYSGESLESIVIAMNDRVHMTREQIADWLDNLHDRGIIDLNAQVEVEETE